MSMLVKDNDWDEVDLSDDEYEDVIELPHIQSTLEQRLCDLQDNFNELRRAVRDCLEAMQEAEDELAEILNNFSPEE